MINKKNIITLASRSPRRRKLLKQLNIKFKSISVDTEEKVRKGEKPASAVKRISKEKLEKAKETVKRGIIITADTIVVLNNNVIGKPKNEKNAYRILKMLSDNIHTVYTGYSIFNWSNDKKITEFEKTLVKFRKLTDEEIWEYIKSGSPMDKAGAYGIQDDFGAVFIEKVNGCYYNVVGLPLAKLYHSLLRIL
ncbi:MAG: Maf family protein [Ignavibacteriaceae bacterium]|nr:Maf family protein [Ignavibacteriaceae bacterium]